MFILSRHQQAFTFVIRKKYYICFKGVSQPVSATCAHTKVVSRARRRWGDLGIRWWLAQMTFILPNPESRHSDLSQLPGKQPMCSGDSKIWVRILCLPLMCSGTLGLSEPASSGDAGRSGMSWVTTCAPLHTVGSPSVTPPSSCLECLPAPGREQRKALLILQGPI